MPSNFGFFMSLTGTCIGVGLVVRETIGGKKYTYKTDAAKNKLFLITGATSGLGEATARELAIRKAKVVLACRNMPECEIVAKSIRLASKNKAVECRELDLSSQESIRNFVEKFNERYKKLDVLINNAGVMTPKRKTTAEGIELQLGVNHMGHFLLTNLLLPKLKAAAPSRIINVTSTNYKNTTINKEDLNSTKSFDSMKVYQQSKAANALFTLELAERLAGTGVTVNAVYPGVTNTRLTRDSSYYQSYFSSIFLKPFLWMFIKNTKHGSQPIIYAAIDPELQDVTGYIISTNFVKEELVPCPQEDQNMKKWLWDVSMKWTRLRNSAS